MRPLPVAVLAALALFWLPAQALAGDAATGGRLAKQWCAACHLVDAAQASASDAAPSFIEVAKDPATTRAGLEVWLADPHPPMPNLNLSNREIDDLITYIESLGGEN